MRSRTPAPGSMVQGQRVCLGLLASGASARVLIEQLVAASTERARQARSGGQRGVELVELLRRHQMRFCPRRGQDLVDEAPDGGS